MRTSPVVIDATVFRRFTPWAPTALFHQARRHVPTEPSFCGERTGAGVIFIVITSLAFGNKLQIGQRRLAENSPGVMDSPWGCPTSMNGTPFFGGRDTLPPTGRVVRGLPHGIDGDVIW